MPSFPILPAAEPTKETRFLNRVANLNASQFERICQLQREGIVAAWQNPNFTPAEAMALMGTGAAKVFQRHGILTQAILDIAAVDGITAAELLDPEQKGGPKLLLPTKAFTVNQDGTVTVLETPYQP